MSAKIPTTPAIIEATANATLNGTAFAAAFAAEEAAHHAMQAARFIGASEYHAATIAYNVAVAAATQAAEAANAAWDDHWASLHPGAAWLHGARTAKS